jgi:aminopeptidase N
MGNDAFFAALRDFIAAHRYGLVTGRELLEYLRSRSEADLGPIYARYLAAY